MSQWELLVTKGHVRAARWRNAVPVLVASAVVAIVVGVGITVLLPSAERSNAVADAQRGYADRQRSAVSAFLEDKGQVERAPPNAERAFTRDAGLSGIAQALASIGETGRLPAHVVQQNPDEFWRLEWQPGAVHAVQDGETILVGYLVDTSYRHPSYRPQPQLRRAFWVFRQIEGNNWSNYCLRVEGAMPCESQAIEPSTIPVTLRGLLPSRVFAGSQS